MPSALKAYRIYCFDAARHIVASDFIRASSDEEAIVEATAAGFGSKCEIWDERRLVAQLDGKERAAG